jgi:hypothetical protein
MRGKLAFAVIAIVIAVGNSAAAQNSRWAAIAVWCPPAPRGGCELFASGSGQGATEQIARENAIAQCKKGGGMKPDQAKYCTVARVFSSGCVWTAIGRSASTDGFGYGYGSSAEEAVTDCTREGLSQCTRLKPERTCVNAQ